MVVKLILALVVIGALLFFLYSQGMLTSAFPFLRIKPLELGWLGSFLSGLPIFQGFFGEAESFLVEVEVDYESFKQQEVGLGAAELKAQGVCWGVATVHTTPQLFMDLHKQKCKLEGKAHEGKLRFNSMVGMNLLVSEFYLDKPLLFAEPTWLELELTPEVLSAKNVTASHLLFTADGRATRLTPEGEEDVTKILRNETLEIKSFMGSLELVEGKLILRGTATYVGGEGWSV